jgi:hypothetical protein
MKAPRVRRSRWLSIPDVLEQILQRSNRFAKRIAARPRASQLKAVRRLVLRAEQRDDVRLTKRLGREILVRVDALDALAPADQETVTRLSLDVVEVVRSTKQLRIQQNGQALALRDVQKRLGKVEKKTALLVQIAELDSAS